MARTPYLSVVMPCLNEEKTVASCVQKARAAIKRGKLRGEVIVSDNGSTDNSIKLARKAGARVVEEKRKGYGSAYLAGIIAAKGDWVVMGDSDGTYDFSAILDLLRPLADGFDMVIGSRLAGRLEKGSMPLLNRYLGTPTLNFFIRLFYNIKVSDSQSGMRAFTKEAFSRLQLKTTGMEFASEMLVRAGQEKLKITEVPINYSSRIAPTKLSRFRDAWRHIRFMLLFAPTYLFLIPGGIIMLLGFLGVLSVALGEITLFGRLLNVHAMVLGSMLTLLGYQIIMLGVYAKAYSWTQGFNTGSLVMTQTLKYFRLEKGLYLGFLFALLGLLVGGLTFVQWAKEGFGYLWALRPAILSMTFFVLGVQIIFSSFFLSILGIEKRN